MSLSTLAPETSVLGTVTPITISGGSQRARAASATSITSRDSRILLVDDDPAILRVTEIVLRAAGYSVVSASDARQALAEYRGENAIHMLLTDVNMPPGINGLELAEIVSLERPKLPVVVMSGAVLTAEQERVVRNRAWAFIEKPFLVSRLLSVISLLLHRPPSTPSSSRLPFPKAG